VRRLASYTIQVFFAAGIRGWLMIKNEIVMDGAIKVPERVVPVPSTISHEAQNMLRLSVDPSGTPLNALQSLPAVDDVEAWMRLKDAVGGYYDAAAERLSPTVSSSVEPIALGDAAVYIATPRDLRSKKCAYIDLHGGAFVFGGGAACRIGAQVQADLHGITCYSVDYRMPPEHPYPAALDDCMAAYRYVLEVHEPEDVIVAGRSAGGNLAAALLLRARELGLPLPAALVLLSPELDLTESGDSFQVNSLVDVVLPFSLMPCNMLYANGADLTHPFLSPLFGNVDGFPPTFLQSGTRDLFLSNSARMHRALRRAGVAAELHVFEGMPHGGFNGSPEDRELNAEVALFVRQHIGIDLA
jgi:monoterpene epsilon-lactone hydrolase